MHPWLWYGELVQIGTYPVMVVLAFCAATAILRREALFSGLAVRLVMDAAFFGIVAGLVGARLFHVVVESPTRYLADPLAALSPYGGWTFYGGMIGAFIAIARYSRHRGANAWAVLDVFAVAMPFAQAVSRLGCLASGCCYGRLADWPVGIAVPWAVTVDQHNQLPDALLAVPLHPAALYLSLLGVGLFVALSTLHRRQPPSGVVFAALLVSYGVGRGILDSFRGDTERGLWLWQTTSSAQLTSVLMVAVGLWLWRRRSAAHSTSR